MNMREILPNGVYIVYQDGSFELFSEELERKEEGMQVGISWDGHKWILGKDYGKLPWTEAGFDELLDETHGIMSACEAILDWHVEIHDKYLRKFFKHIPFADGEMMPVCPMVLVQEKLARDGVLNDALYFCGLPEYETGIIRWFVERYKAYYSRYFNGCHGYLNTTYVYNRCLRVHGVKVWK